VSVSFENIVKMMGGVQGIDWAALAARGKGTVWDADYITDYLLPAYGRALKVFDTLNFKPESDQELIDNYVIIKEKLSSPLEFAEAAWNVGRTILQPDQGVGLSEQELRSFTYYMWLTLTNGAYMHLHAAIHYSGASDEDIADHAQWITTMCNTVAKLDQLGVFKPVKKAGFSGNNYTLSGVALGIAPLVVVAIVVVAIAALAALAYMILGATEVIARETTVYKMCRDAGTSGDAKQMELCQGLARESPKPGSDLGTTIVTVVAVAAAGYILVAFGPTIVQSLKQSLEKSKSKTAEA
jgi:hypothetical protein